MNKNACEFCKPPAQGGYQIQSYWQGKWSPDIGELLPQNWFASYDEALASAARIHERGATHLPLRISLRGDDVLNRYEKMLRLSKNGMITEG